MRGINSRDLDNWITGHYGEDQFKNIEPTAHELHVMRAEPDDYNPYTYDPADDGPEVEIIRRLRGGVK